MMEKKDKEIAKEGIEKGFRMVGMLSRAGVKIIAGTNSQIYS